MSNQKSVFVYLVTQQASGLRRVFFNERTAQYVAEENARMSCRDRAEDDDLVDIQAMQSETFGKPAELLTKWNEWCEGRGDGDQIIHVEKMQAEHCDPDTVDIY